MPVKVSFDIDNADDRAAVRDMLAIYEPDIAGCDHDHSPHGTNTLNIPAERFKGVDIVEGLKTLSAELAGHSNVVQFTATLPGDDGSEEVDDAAGTGYGDIDLTTIGFGQSDAVIHPEQGVYQVNDPKPADTVTENVTAVAAPATVTASSAPPPPPPPPATVEPLLDSRGYPWDARIHSSSKALNQDGTHRYKKGLNPVTKNEVEAALKGVVVAAMPQNISVAQTVTAPASPAIDSAPTASPTVSAPPPPPPPVAAAPALTFAKVIQQMTMARWDKATMDARLAAHGVTFPTLATRSDLFATIYAEAGGK